MSGRSPLLGLRHSLVALVLFAGVFLVPISSLTAACNPAGPDVLKIAVPTSYKELLDPSFSPAPKHPTTEPTCVLPIVANEYQALAWLENGKVDASIVGTTAAALLTKSNPQIESLPTIMVYKEWPFDKGEIRKYGIALKYWKGGAWIEEPEAQFKDRLAAGPLPYIVLSSHLSPALPRLFLFVRDALAAGRISTKRQGEVWEKLVEERLSFTLGRSADPELAEEFLLSEVPPEECSSKTAFCLSEKETLQDLVLIRSYARRRLFLDNEPHIKNAAEGFSTEQPWMEPPEVPAVLHQFWERNFRLEEHGPVRQRFFRFTVQELWKILRAGNDEYLALVLSGGGVKAAYQTALIERLYKEGYLSNAITQTGPAPGTLTPTYVIGTSGGALLGLFVASIKDNKTNLIAPLWKTTGDRFVEATDVFPFVDMPRWFSAVFCGVLFGIVCLFVRFFRGAGAQPRQKPEDGSRFLVSIVWLFLLVGSPFLLRFYNGEMGKLHVPAEAGLAYFILLSIGLYSDARLSWKGKPSFQSLRFPPHIVALIAVGLLSAVVAPAIFGNSAPLFPTMRISLNALIACIGLGLLFIGIHLFWVNQSKLLDAEYLSTSRYNALSAGLLFLLVPGLTYSLLLLMHWVTRLTLFELTTDFVEWLGLSALLVCIVLVIAGVWFRVRLLNRGFEFLYSSTPSAPLGVQLPQFVRMLTFFTVGWLGWNLVVAPGVYGNQVALQYLRCAYQRFQSTECDEQKWETARKLDFRTHLVLPATSIQNERELYFLFEPSGKEAKEADEHGHFPLATRRKISSDPRWYILNEEDQTADRQANIAFASGAAFPIFPQLKVEGPHNENFFLVDGGYAHNIPTEAAQALGAKRILILRSSFLESETDDAPESVRGLGLLGSMSVNLPRLLPYLYNRSQIEDNLSSQGLLVASLSPIKTRERSPWPILTDFRSSIVESLLKYAESDFNKRIGAVESWGEPKF